MMRPRHAGALVLVCAGVLLAGARVLRGTAAAQAPVKGLTHAPLLVRAYELVYDADFAGADAELKRACGPAPAQACAWHVSEINTMPGFTTISMYPRLWEASGLAYGALLDRLIDLGLERHAAKQELRTSAS